MNSWMVELIAVYSPPMPAPVRKRNNAKLADIPRKRGGSRRQQIDGQRDEEQLPAPEPVGQPAEAEGAEHRAGKVGAIGEADLDITQMQHRALLQRARHRTGQRHLEPVQHPGDAKRNDDKPVEAAPGQTIEPRRDIRVHHVCRDASFTWTRTRAG